MPLLQHQAQLGFIPAMTTNASDQSANGNCFEEKMPKNCRTMTDKDRTTV